MLVPVYICMYIHVEVQGTIYIMVLPIVNFLTSGGQTGS